MTLEAINPPALGEAKGYNNGIIVPGGARLLLIAGQIGWDAKHQFPPDGPDAFLNQFTRALDNVLEVIKAAGGKPDGLARLTMYVTDKKLYNACVRDIGKVWKERLGRHYPAMALVEVKGLLEDKALVELEGTAAL